MKSVDFEEDYIERAAAVPGAAPARQRAAGAAAEAGDLPAGARWAPSIRAASASAAATRGANDDLDRIMASFREALELYAPEDLWERGGPELSDAERSLLTRTASWWPRCSPRAAPRSRWPPRCWCCRPWSPKNRGLVRPPGRAGPLAGDRRAAGADRGGAARRAHPDRRARESIASVWVAPNVVERLAEAYLRRQERLSTLLRRPLGAVPNRGAIGELLLEGDTVQGTAMNVAGAVSARGPARARQRRRWPAPRASRATIPSCASWWPTPASGKAGPRRVRWPWPAGSCRASKSLGGTSNDAVDLGASLEVLIDRRREVPPGRGDPGAGLAGGVPHPGRVPVAALPGRGAAAAGQGRAPPARSRPPLAAELLERSFLKLQQRIGDTERLGPATREAEALRQRLGENRRRFGDERLKNRNAEIDVELAKGLLNAGQVVEAEALLVRAVAVRGRRRRGGHRAGQAGHEAGRSPPGGRDLLERGAGASGRERTARRPSPRWRSSRSWPTPWATPTRWPGARTRPARPGGWRCAAGSG